MRKGFCASEKYIIGIREYMEIYLNAPYDWNGKLTHKKMYEFCGEKGYLLPKRGIFNQLDTEAVLRGDVYLVKDEVGKIIPYRNMRLNLKQILEDVRREDDYLPQRRTRVLKEQGLRETVYGDIVKDGIIDPEEFDESSPRKLGSLLTNNNRVKKLVNRKINH